ncbi:MAG: hypothetical protein H0U74_07130 [Bradymonadaceae bacterium]|nr:hypothetical protein [Lujinxingiaceae bacterium]
MNRVGLRREDKDRWERRAPLVPRDVVDLVAEDITVFVQPSLMRAFGDEAYATAGAALREDLSDCEVILGIGEIPLDYVEPGATYLLFSHTPKTRAPNRALVKRIVECGATLIDYELITSEDNKRLVFLGRHAGYSGAIETLVALAQKYETAAIRSPLARLEPLHNYRDLDEALSVLAEIGEEIRQDGLDERIAPLAVAVLGYGHVSEAVQQVLNALGVEWIDPAQLTRLEANASRHAIYAALFKEEHMVAPIDSMRPFALSEFYDHPERFHSVVATYLPHTSAVITTYFWEPGFPGYVPDQTLAELAASYCMPMHVIGDITSDTGVCVDASRHFSHALRPFVTALAQARLDALSLDQSGLPRILQRACIVWRGQLSERFDYLQSSLLPE